MAKDELKLPPQWAGDVIKECHEDTVFKTSLARHLHSSVCGTYGRPHVCNTEDFRIGLVKMLLVGVYYASGRALHYSLFKNIM